MRQTPCWDAPSARGVSAFKPGKLQRFSMGEQKTLKHFQYHPFSHYPLLLFLEFPQKLLLFFSHKWIQNNLRYQTYILSFIRFFSVVTSSFLWERSKCGKHEQQSFKLPLKPSEAQQVLVQLAPATRMAKHLENLWNMNPNPDPNLACFLCIFLWILELRMFLLKDVWRCYFVYLHTSNTSKGAAMVVKNVSQFPYQLGCQEYMDILSKTSNIDTMY